jgi:S-DNA-T family DNA segregation ATPase FtsK/SpoIIIE
VKRVADLTLRLVVRLPKGTTRELAVTSPADLPARAAAAALSEALGLDPARHQAIRLATGGQFGDAPLSKLGLRQGDEVMLREKPSNGTSSGSQPLVELTIEEPERPPRTIALPAGEHLLGRQADRVVVELHDPTVSRVHAALSVARDRITITDRGAVNKTCLEGVELGPQVTTSMSLPAAMTLGRTIVRVAWRAGRDTPVAAKAPVPVETANERGEVQFNRPLRVKPPLPSQTLTVAAAPADPQKSRIPLATSVVPIAIAVPMALALGQPGYMLFALMSPAIALVSFWDERRHGASAFKTQSATFKESVEETLRKALQLRAGETERRNSDAPDPTILADWIHRRATRLWERRPDDDDFLGLRIGLGSEPSAIKVEVGNGGNEELHEWALRYVEANAAVSDVPIAIDLAKSGSVGIVGPKAQVDALARWLVAQAAGLQSPRDLAIAAIVSDQGAASWDWLKWLPQSRPEGSPLRTQSLAGPSRLGDLVTDLRKLQASRAPGAGSSSTHARQSKRPWLLLLVDGSAPVDRAAIAPLLSSGLEAGIATIWTASQAEDVPGDCQALIRIDANGNASLIGHAGESHTGIKPDNITIDAARDMALSMAPLADISAEQSAGGVPGSVGLLETLDAPDGALDEWMGSAWRGSDDSLRVPIGALADDCLELDIEKDGPHGLVAGTTGAGKSELLQSLVGALAATHSPSRVTFLLVDYKGGAAFSDCRDLPHTVGYVTDLDPGLAERALVSLRAEIKRRELIAASAHVNDFRALRRKDASCPPSLVIVVDEFAALLKELPEFVSGVLDVAQRGRAYGVHLVLGTQSPSGNVTDAVMANIGFRIALRTTSEEQSRSIINSEVAASISPDSPGRAWIRLPSGDLRQFQSAYANARRTTDQTASVTVHDFGFKGGSTRRRTENHEGTTDLAVIAEAGQRAFAASGESEPHKPWLPPMPAVIKASSLAPDGLAAPLGLVDEAERQRQVAAMLDLETMGGLMVYGGPGSGRTTLLRTAVSGLAELMGPEDLYVYGLDFGAGALRMLEQLPQCGGIIHGDDLERAIRLLRMLRGEIERRKSLSARSGLSFAGAAASNEPGEKLPRIVLVIDTYEGFAAAFEKVAYGEWLDLLPKMAADGRAVGIHFLVSASRRSGVPSALIGALEQRVVLRLSEPDDYMQVGLHINPRQIPDLPPGRGFTGDTSLMQCAVVGGAEDSEQTMGIRQVAARVKERFASAPVPNVGRLAASVDAASLPPTLEDGAFVIGIGDSTLGPVGVRPADGHFLVAGPGHSGRTTALLTLLGSMKRGGNDWPVHFLAPRDAPRAAAADAFDRLVTGVEACTEYLASLEWEPAVKEFGNVVLVIDDAEELAELFDDSTELIQVTRRRPPGVWIVMAAQPEGARSYQKGLKAIRSHRHGLLLSPNPDIDGETLSAKLPRFSPAPGSVGRGYLVRREELELVQVAK